MNRFYEKLSKPMKKIFLILTTPLVTLAGAILGLQLGIYSINFIPDQCVTEGISTICQNPFEFMGLVGWEGTATLGFIIGGILSLASYLMLIFWPESKK